MYVYFWVKKINWSDHPQIPKSVTIEMDGRKIGIIGYVTSDTPV